MRQYTISVGGSRMASIWQERRLSWDDLLNRIRNPERGVETQQEYFKLPKSKQDELKDVGGFVGGQLKNGKRTTQSVLGRDLITLDLDAIPANETQNIVDKVKGLGYSFIIYSTRKHTPRKPRLRVLIPLDRTATPDEYEPVARMIAMLIGISYCDTTTFQPSRLFYWPSASADAEYVFEHGEAAECCVNTVLSMYADWRDVSAWPIVPGEQNKVATLHKHQEDPETKRGMVGAFCRTYDIYSAIEQFLPEEYTGSGDRLTYCNGSTSGGAIVYEDGKFLYSHHATDPCSGLLVNAFDLVRLHKFGHLDEGKEAKHTDLPSYKAMLNLCSTDEKVQMLIAKEQEEAAVEAFGAVQAADDYDPLWRMQLEKNSEGGIMNTVENVKLIIQNDKLLRKRIWYDEFADRIMVTPPVPWSNEDVIRTVKSIPVAQTRPWSDVDDTGLYWYVEKEHSKKITLQKAIAGINLTASLHKVNPVVEYLESRVWDGIPRAETLLIDYLGAEDNPYVRAVTRKVLVAAVMRAYEPGTKFDNMLILVGRQGIGKSTVFKKLGGDWFSDSLTTFEGKDAAELIQGVWIVEVGELTAMTRQESNSVKQFLSKQDDQYRAAYARRKETHPRRCIFVGTSNEHEFLKDVTGNRRFWPVNVGVHEPKLSVFDDLTLDVVGKIWAEAVWYAFGLGEGKMLYLPRDIEAMADKEQMSHMIMTGKEGMVEEFLEKQIPESWYEMEPSQRMMFLNGNLEVKDKLVERRRVCVSEIWACCFGKSLTAIQRQDSIEIGRIMKNLGWKSSNGPLKFGDFGQQRGFVKDD